MQITSLNIMHALQFAVCPSVKYCDILIICKRKIYRPGPAFSKQALRDSARHGARPKPFEFAEPDSGPRPVLIMDQKPFSMHQSLSGLQHRALLRGFQGRCTIHKDAWPATQMMGASGNILSGTSAWLYGIFLSAVLLHGNAHKQLVAC